MSPKNRNDLDGVRARRRNQRGQRPDHKPHPEKPPRPTTTTQPPVIIPQPVPVEGTRIIRIYDYTDKYSPYVAQGAEYYRSWLAPYGVDVQYIRRPPNGAVCWQGGFALPDIGIKMCEDLGPGTAGSTGMNWIPTGPNAWALSSSIDFNEGDYAWVNSTADGIDTTENEAGLYIVNHELGHSCGNLPHREMGDVPYSCMSANGGRAPDDLLESEKQQIIDLLPRASSLAGLVRQGPIDFSRCILPVIK